ncbi:MAG: hypothetical protein IIZ96_06690 [Oscillospiraceae bacterium]|nr:hypothetical protein [Oscillospiraceae bacterium]
MAETTITLARTAAAVIDQAYPSNHSNFADGTVITNTNGSQRILLAQFEQLASNYKYAKIVKATLGGGASAVGASGLLAVSQAGAANLSTVTWETQPSINSAWIGYDFISRVSPTRFSFPYPFPKGKTQSPEFTSTVLPAAYTAQEASQAAKQLLKAATLAFWAWRTDGYEDTTIAYREGTGSITTPTTFTPFNLYVVIDPAVTIQNTVRAKDDTPRTGYMSPYEAHTFAWDFVSSDDTYTCFGSWAQASATFYYRNGDSGAFTQISARTSTSVTLLASAFSVGTFQWYVTATDTDGRTTTSPVYTLSTADSLPTCTPIAPVDTVEDGSKPIVFEWSVSIDTGTTPTGADLQISSDGSTWSTLGTVSGAATTWSAAPGTIGSGTKYWRVRAYNADSVAGGWSAASSFVCISAEAPPVVSCDGKPFAEISWQSANQQAYRVTVDGVLYGPYFGTTKTFSVPDYLEDGGHTVSVEIQNSFGLWSNPGSVSFTVANVPGAAVSLSGLFYLDADLSWSSEDQNADFLIYRDGAKIGHTSGSSFTDRVVLGYHAWHVINRLPGGYYTASNTVSGTLCTEGIAMALLSGGSWIDLTLSANSDRTMTWNHSQSVAVRQFAGREYPDAETSPYRNTSVSFDVAWAYKDADQAAAFAELVGKPVLLKTPCEGVLVGILSAWQRENTHFYKAYTATIQRINWRDFTDADD